jgi:hypothetical protein
VAVVCNIPVACNRATADFMISSPLMSRTHQPWDPSPDRPLPGQPLPGQPLPDPALPDQALPDQALPDQALPDQPLQAVAGSAGAAARR